MIKTVTLNPAIDYHIGLNEFQEGGSLSATASSFFVGGKGINVSRVLSNLGVESEAIALLGGFTGEFIRENAGVDLEVCSIKEKTRINTKLKVGYQETEIHGLAPFVTEEEIDNIKRHMQGMTGEDILVLSGSIPRGVATDIYKKLGEYGFPAKIVIDTRGQALKKALELENIFLIKPNKDEIGEYFGCVVQSNEQALELVRRLQKETNVEYLILSLGVEGAYLLAGSSILYAPALKGELVSSVGAGDSLVAGFVAGYIETKDVCKAFALGIACGAGTAFSEGLCTRETVDRLLGQIDIQTIL